MLSGCSRDARAMRLPNNVHLEDWIRLLIREKQIYKFYKTDEWIELRDDVLREDHYECQHCLKQGRYTRAYMVHHVNEVRKRPGLALSRTYIDKEGSEQRNLVSLCFACHEAEHDRFEMIRAEQGKEKFSNDERW